MKWQKKLTEKTLSLPRMMGTLPSFSWRNKFLKQKKGKEKGFDIKREWSFNVKL